MDGTTYTGCIRKFHMELYFKLEGGWCACINLIPAAEGLYLVADTGDLDEDFEKVLPKVGFKKGEFEVTSELITKRHQLYSFASLGMDCFKEKISGIYRLIPTPKHECILELLGNKEVRTEARFLVKYVTRVYNELHDSPHPELKPLLLNFVQ